MSDTPREGIEHRLALVARGVQRMADSFGSLEERLAILERRVAEKTVVDLTRPFDRLVNAIGSLRDDLAVAVGERGAAPADDARLASIEQLVTALRDELAIDRLEASMRDLTHDTSGLRADVRRSFDRVLHEISSTEEALKGEVRAIDNRLTGFGDDLRLVRGLRDGLEALASGVDAVRQLASRTATSSQMAELAGDLSSVLAEIESARSHVLAVDQQVGRVQASGAIDVTPAAMTKDVEDLERKVTSDIADLGARIEEIAERAVTVAPPVEPDDPVAARLRSLATSARQLSMGIAEDLKARRAAKKPRPRKPVHER